MNEDFAPFELAVKLKEKGFGEPCLGWYYPSEVCGFDYKTTIVFNNSEYRGSNYKDMLVSHKNEKHIDAPTISQVLKWLREEKKIYCLPYFEQGIDMWLYAICKPAYGCEFPKFISESDYDTYEQSALAGIEYVLDNLI